MTIDDILDKYSEYNITTELSDNDHTYLISINSPIHIGRVISTTELTPTVLKDTILILLDELSRRQ